MVTRCTKPMVFQAHGYVLGCFVWAARRFHPGSLLNRALYRAADYVSWSQVKRAWPPLPPQ